MAEFVPPRQRIFLKLQEVQANRCFAQQFNVFRPHKIQLLHQIHGARQPLQRRGQANRLDHKRPLTKARLRRIRATRGKRGQQMSDLRRFKRHRQRGPDMQGVIVMACAQLAPAIGVKPGKDIDRNKPRPRRLRIWRHGKISQNTPHIVGQGACQSGSE